MIKHLKGPQGNAFGRADSLKAEIRRAIKQGSTFPQLPKITKSAQIFVAMWFNDEVMGDVYEQGYKEVINGCNFKAERIDEEQFNGSIIAKIYEDIANSRGLIADLTGNRGGVYFEAGIARGLMLAKAPMQVIFTCRKDYFCNPETKPHFDVSTDNIIVYKDNEDLRAKLTARIQETILE
ncbi:MAG: hypothetical protein LBG97_01085 [Coriobacteriales bacterium]|nr:hypothetical protein [Coriobacteriales bacterium]